MSTLTLTKLLNSSVVIILCASFATGCSKAGTAQSQDSSASGQTPSGGQPTSGKPGTHGNPNQSVNEQLFRGYIQHRTGVGAKSKILGVTPITIDLRFSKVSPTQTTVTETINVGFFGGVQVATDNVTQDLGTGTLTAIFGTGANPLRVIATYNGVQMLNAQLSGPNSGVEAIQIIDRVNSGDLPKNQNVYDLAFAKPNISVGTPGGKTPVPTTRVSGRLSLVPQIEAIPSNGASDLPMLPSLNASIALDGMGELITSVPSVIYDPLRGTIEMTLSNRNMFRFEHVYVDPKTPWGTDPSDMSGNVLAGSSQYAGLIATASDAKIFRFGTLLQNFYYQGTLKASDGAVYQVTGALVNQNQVVANTADYIVPNIPVLELRVFICVNNREFGHMNFLLSGLEPIFTMAKFSQERAVGTGNVQALFNYGPGWSSISGSIQSPKTGSDGSGDMTLSLHQTGGAPTSQCQ